MAQQATEIQQFSNKKHLSLLISKFGSLNCFTPSVLKDRWAEPQYIMLRQHKGIAFPNQKDTTKH